MATDDRAVTAALVSGDKRMDFLPTYFRRHMMDVEAWAYAFLRDICKTYAGSESHFYSLSNGGAFISPADEAVFAIAVSGNGYCGTMSAEAAGITSTLLTLSSLSMEASEPDLLVKRFRQLQAYANGHPEAYAILLAID
jgi:hypothetical protein